jgi:polysaccharide export outer membrane protein
VKLTLILLISAFAGAQTRPALMNDPSATNLPAQRIGPNDLLAVSVYDAPELTRTVRVGADGAVRIPMLRERIAVESMMPGEVETAIAEALKREQLIVDPFVTVTVAEYHSRPISVMGSVKKPTTFQAVGPMTLLEALARAEGLTLDAGPEVLVSRSQPGPQGAPIHLVKRIPVKALIDAADPEMNLKLVGGEEIRVPEAGRVFVVGNVKKPGSFVVRDDSETTVLKALAMSEGLMQFASQQAYIYRREGSAGGAKNEIPIELKKIMERKSPDVPLQANDILYVPDRQGRRIGMAALEKIIMFGGGAATAAIYAGVR